MNYFGLSCVFAILLVALLLVTTFASGVTGNTRQAQADGITNGITKTDTYHNTSVIIKSLKKNI